MTAAIFKGEDLSEPAVLTGKFDLTVGEQELRLGLPEHKVELLVSQCAVYWYLDSPQTRQRQCQKNLLCAVAELEGHMVAGTDTMCVQQFGEVKADLMCLAIGVAPLLFQDDQVPLRIAGRSGLKKAPYGLGTPGGIELIQLRQPFF